MFLNEIIDLPTQFISNFILFCELFENLQISVLFLILHSDVTYKGSHAVNVISEDDTADRLDEYHNKCLLIALRSYVSKTDGEHDGSAPIVRPNVLFEPGCFQKVMAFNPTVFRVDLSHTEEQNR
jgi:hypothetical protein